MKNIVLLAIAILLCTGSLFSQGNIGINDPSPDPLAVLDIESTTQGVLIPRMTEAQRSAIAVTAAQNGMLVYQTDNNAGFWYFDGAAWGKLGGSGGRLVGFAMGSDSGNNPANALAFIGPTAVVTVTDSGQKIVVTCHKGLGSTAAGGASNLDIWIGYRLSGSASDPIAVGSGIYGLQVPQNTRVPIGINGIITNLPPGDYEVGMVGHGYSSYANWNNNEYGYVTVLVFD